MEYQVGVTMIVDLGSDLVVQSLVQRMQIYELDELIPGIPHFVVDALLYGIRRNLSARFEGSTPSKLDYVSSRK